MMTTLTICLFIVIVAVIVLAALFLYRGGHVTARCKLPGVDFSIDARDRKD